MTQRLYQEDSYRKTMTSRVRAVLPEGVILEETVFFPQGGGVLGDCGVLTTSGGRSEAVLDTLEHEAGVLHCLGSTLGFSPGQAVEGQLDWERRYTLMRYHTATHTLAGLLFQAHQVRVSGNQLTTEKGRIDFTFQAFDRKILEEGLADTNALIAGGRPVRISTISAAEAQGRPELFKLETGFKHQMETLRLVEIVGVDVQADGGCHVADLREIGQLSLLKVDNKGKQNRRVYFQIPPARA